MTKQSGYIVTIKAFIPSPKNDFAKQAAAATAMQEITTTKTLPANFAELAAILDIGGKYGSADIPDAAPPSEQTQENTAGHVTGASPDLNDAAHTDPGPADTSNDRTDIGDDVGSKKKKGAASE